MANSLIYGAVILFVTNLINRILGFVYQYLIMRHVGSEAFGLFYMVFPVYMTALVFTTAGIPLAISRMVSEKVSIGRHADAHKIFKIALLTLFCSGLFVSLFLYFNTPYIVEHFFSDKRVAGVFKICIPAVFVVSVASAFRGYFQGLQNMIPSAMSQVCEQILRVLLGFCLSLKLLSRGIEWAAVGLATGMLGGEIIGFIVILAHYLVHKRHTVKATLSTETPKSILSGLFRLSLPVTGGRLMSTGLSALDAVIIPKQLVFAGYSARSATSLFGQLNGTALTLVTFPSVFTFALATSLVPSISEAITRKEYRTAQSRCLDAIRFTIILGLPCVIAMFFFAENLTGLFKSHEVASVLKILSVGGIFAYLLQTTTGILQGLGKTFLPFLHSTISAAIRIPLLFYLTGIPSLGLKGTALAYICGYFCVALLNLLAIRRHIGLKFDYKAFIIQPLSAAAGMVLTIFALSYVTPAYFWAALGTAAVGFAVYTGLLIFNGGLSKRDLLKVPLLNRFIPF